MAYSNLTLSKLQDDFQLHYHHQSDIFAGISEIPISAYLMETLDENTSVAVAMNTEKGRSELLVAPILMEVRKQFDRQISFFSGVDFDVDKEHGLNGFCDFIISLSPEQLFLNAPVITIVEAKNNNPIIGLAQCIGSMVAAQTYNQRKKNPLEMVYGTITSGTTWMFLKLVDKTAHIDMTEYSVKQPEKIIGILSAMLRQEA